MDNITGSMGYKVVQWATGGVGKEALRGIIQHPQLERKLCILTIFEHRSIKR